MIYSIALILCTIGVLRVSIGWIKALIKNKFGRDTNKWYDYIQRHGYKPHGVSNNSSDVLTSAFALLLFGFVITFPYSHAIAASYGLDNTVMRVGLYAIYGEIALRVCGILGVEIFKNKAIANLEGILMTIGAISGLLVSLSIVGYFILLVIAIIFMISMLKR